MPINITMTFDTVEEAIKGLKTWADNFSSTVSVNTLDTARHEKHIDDASPAEEAVDTQPPKKGRGRPPKGKTTENPPPDAGTDQAGEASSEPQTETPNDVSDKDVQDVIVELTKRYKDGDDAQRTKIRTWRDTVGIARMADLKSDHVAQAREFLSTLGA